MTPDAIADIGNPIYTRLAFETSITDAQAAFCRLACGTDYRMPDWDELWVPDRPEGMESCVVITITGGNP